MDIPDAIDAGNVALKTGASIIQRLLPDHATLPVSQALANRDHRRGST
jgi:hypothetical protein